MSIEQVLKNSKTIAIVGMSPNSERPSHGVSNYLIKQGYEVFGVNPKVDEIHSRPVYPSLKNIPHSIDVVDVFRKPEHVSEIAKEAIEIGAKALWLQEGVTHPEAEKMAKDAGLEVISDLCILKEHKKL